MKMDASCGVIDAAGSWRGPMLGSDNSVACWFVMNIYSVPIARSSISPASGLRSGGVFETRSRVRTVLRFTATGIVLGVLLGWPISLVSGDINVVILIGSLGTVIGIILGVVHRNDPAN